MSSGELPVVSPRQRAEAPAFMASHGARIGSVTVQEIGGLRMPDDVAGLRMPEHMDSHQDFGDRVGMVPHASKAALPSSVIHELRTPLTSIHGYAQVLQRVLRDEPRAENALAVIVRESGRLTGMLAALSDLAEIDGNDCLVQLTHVDVRAVVDDAVDDVSRRDGGCHPIAVTGHATIHSDGRRLMQVLQQVLTNATQYAEPGSPVHVSIDSSAGSVEIAVEDQGIGINPDDRHLVFERFQRGSNARQTGVRGLGLGLYLARANLGLVGGSLDHEPRPGGGTVFRITLPAR